MTRNSGSDRDLPEPCPSCGTPCHVVYKTTDGERLSCPNPDCPRNSPGRDLDGCGHDGLSTDGGTEANVSYRGTGLSAEELVDLHACILSTRTNGRECKSRECENDAIVMASVPCHHVCIPICLGCIPDHVRWYEMEPERRRADSVAHEVAASLNPEVDYVRS